MEKVLTVGGHEIPVRSSAASLFSYKANFGRDGLKDMIALTKGLPSDAKKISADALADSAFDFDVFYRFLWVFAKSATPDIPPLVEWLDTIDVPPIDFAMEALPQITDLLMGSVKSSTKAKK